MAGYGKSRLGAFTGIRRRCPIGLRCPACDQHTPDAFQPVQVRPPGMHDDGTEIEVGHTRYVVEWMPCGNNDCGEVLIQVTEREIVEWRGPDDVPVVRERSVLVWPSGTPARRKVDPAVPARLRDDFIEAAALLDLSPRMSAVLARSILADLLEEYAGHKQFSLADRIDSFNRNTDHPRALRENLHHFREVADLGAHTKRSDQGNYIKVDRDEAEWTLGLVQRLFDSLIVTPAADEKMRFAIDTKLKAANRRPIKPLPDDPPKPKVK
jgi:uncharacterized protein DUF4145